MKSHRAFLIRDSLIKIPHSPCSFAISRQCTVFPEGLNRVNHQGELIAHGGGVTRGRLPTKHSQTT
jgi:hypothetical protein